LTGKHVARRTRRLPLGPIATAAVISAVVLGGAVGVNRLGAVNSADGTPGPAGPTSSAATAAPPSTAPAAPDSTPSSPAPAAAETPASGETPATPGRKPATPAPTRTSTHPARGGATRASTPSPDPTRSSSPAVVSSGTCEASFYSEPQPTASGEPFDPEAMTAAHQTLPFDTRVRVTNLANGESVIVRINDRGPFVAGRCLDLSRGAFRVIAPLDAGVVDVRYEVLQD
jgi:rare lipoprotein A